MKTIHLNGFFEELPNFRKIGYGTKGKSFDNLTIRFKIPGNSSKLSEITDFDENNIFEHRKS